MPVFASTMSCIWYYYAPGSFCNVLITIGRFTGAAAVSKRHGPLELHTSQNQVDLIVKAVFATPLRSNALQKPMPKEYCVLRNCATLLWVYEPDFLNSSRFEHQKTKLVWSRTVVQIPTSEAVAMVEMPSKTSFPCLKSVCSIWVSMYFSDRRKRFAVAASRGEYILRLSKLWKINNYPIDL